MSTPTRTHFDYQPTDHPDVEIRILVRTPNWPLPKCTAPGANGGTPCGRRSAHVARHAPTNIRETLCHVHYAFLTNGDTADPLNDFIGRAVTFWDARQVFWERCAEYVKNTPDDTAYAAQYAVRAALNEAGEFQYGVPE